MSAFDTFENASAVTSAISSSKVSNLLCYSIAYKAGVIEEDSYGELFSEPKINEMYPSFQESFITTAIKKWIHNGIWDKITIKKEIESIKARDKAQTPYDILRLNRIIDVDEDIIERGYKRKQPLLFFHQLHLK